MRMMDQGFDLSHDAFKYCPGRCGFILQNIIKNFIDALLGQLRPDDFHLSSLARNFIGQCVFNLGMIPALPLIEFIQRRLYPFLINRF